MQYRLAVRRFLEFGSERTLLNGRGCMLTVVASVTAASMHGRVSMAIGSNSAM